MVNLNSVVGLDFIAIVHIHEPFYAIIQKYGTVCVIEQIECNSESRGYKA